MTRAGAMTAVIGSASVFGWGVMAWVRADDGEGWYSVLIPLALAGLVAGCLAVAVGVVRWLLHRTRGTQVPGGVPLPLAASVALLVAAPVHMSWDDGCNDHEARVPSGLVAYVTARDPDVVPYLDSMTVMACSDGPI